MRPAGRARRRKTTAGERSAAIAGGPASGASTAASGSNTRRFVSRGEWLARILRDRILKGRYRPGDRIREIELKQEFDFSNGPVRDAFQLLAAEGLVDR